MGVQVLPSFCLGGPRASEAKTHNQNENQKSRPRHWALSRRRRGCGRRGVTRLRSRCRFRVRSRGRRGRPQDEQARPSPRVRAAAAASRSAVCPDPETPVSRRPFGTFATLLPPPPPPPPPLFPRCPDRLFSQRHPHLVSLSGSLLSPARTSALTGWDLWTSSRSRRCNQGP